jgi:magnesium chelatase family protein
MPNQTSPSAGTTVDDEMYSYPLIALVYAAAGGHHIHLVGRPEDTRQLTHLLPEMLPDLDDATAAEVASIRDAALLPATDSRRPPVEAPHHSTSVSSLVGGGARKIRPGAFSRAHGGVLILEDAPDFAGTALDALRQPLEAGNLHIQRAGEVAAFPARFQMLLTSTASPCGATPTECDCTPAAIRRHLARMSGPLLDRIDITARVSEGVVVPRNFVSLAREVVADVRARQARRFNRHPWATNAAAPRRWLLANTPQLMAESIAPLERALRNGALTLRGYDQALRLALTLADVAGREKPISYDVELALSLRSGSVSR